jgi:hypothetical protein
MHWQRLAALLKPVALQHLAVLIKPVALQHLAVLTNPEALQHLVVLIKPVALAASSGTMGSLQSTKIVFTTLVLRVVFTPGNCDIHLYFYI